VYADFVAEHGFGVHHIGVQVDDADAAIALAKDAGIEMLQDGSGFGLEGDGHFAYLDTVASIGVMVELNCETDFVARSADFTEFSKNVAMHIAALNPIYVRREDVSEPVIESEKSIYREQAKDSGKPEKFWDKIISGRLDKFYSEVCLLEQTYIKDDSRSIQDVLNELIAKLGENISIRRFVRYQLGETVPR